MRPNTAFGFFLFVAGDLADAFLDVAGQLVTRRLQLVLPRSLSQW